MLFKENIISMLNDDEMIIENARKQLSYSNDVISRSDSLKSIDVALRVRSAHMQMLLSCGYDVVYNGNTVIDIVPIGI